MIILLNLFMFSASKKKQPKNRKSFTSKSNDKEQFKNNKILI